MPQECVAGLNFLDLPEEILRHVFSFLPAAEVYYNIRCVCRQLLRYVEGYIEIGKYSNNYHVDYLGFHIIMPMITSCK